MVRIQQLLKEKEKTMTAVKLRIKNEIRNLKLNIATPLNENNPKILQGELTSNSRNCGIGN